MADNFGLKIGVEGEKEFKAALREINQTFKVLGSEMNLVSSQFDKQDKSMEALTARNNVLNKEIDTQKQKIETLRSALENAASSFGENDKRTQAWQIQLNNAQAELNKMEKELDDNNKALDESADGFDDAAKEADDFGDEIQDAAKDTDSAGGKFERLGSIVKGVGVAIGAAMAAIGAAAVAAGKSLYNMATETAAAGDRIDKTSQSLGLSTKGFQEWEYVLSQNGMEIDSLKTGLNKLNNTVDDVNSGNTAAAEKFARLGISMDDLKGKSREDIFNMTIAGLQGVSDEGERAAIANDLLGKSAVELAPLLNQTADSTDALKQKANDLGMVMSAEAVAASVAFTDSMDNLKRTFSGVKNAIVSQLLPGFTQITDGLTALLAGQEGAADQIKAGAEETVEAIANMLPQALDIFTSLISVVATVAPDIIVALVQGITDNLPALIEAATTIIMTLGEGLVAALPQLTEGALQLVLTLAQGILDNLPQILEVAIQVIVTLALGIAEALPELIPSIIEAILLICSTLLDNMDQILAAAFAIIEGLAQGLLNALPKLIEALPKIITGIINFITNNLPKIVEMGIKLVVQLAVGLVKAIPELVKALPQIIVAIVQGLGQAVGSVVEIGKNIVRGLWEGITGLAKWLWDKVSGWISGIWDGICGFFGIKSPSTEMAWVGEMLVKGLAGSINTNGKEAVKAAESMSEDITGVMSQLADEMQTTLPTEFAVDAKTSAAVVPTGAALGGMAGGGPLVMVQQMIVRSEDDIRKISQELYNLMQVGSRAQGRVITA